MPIKMIGGLLWIDVAILGILTISALISLVRGFVKEALSLVGWVLAFWLALTFTEVVASGLESQISVPSIRKAVAFMTLFVATLLVTSVVIYLVDILVQKTGISGTDRMLGIFFGISRGAIIVCILVLLASMTPLPQDPWWTQSKLLPYFTPVAAELRQYLPAELAQSVNL